MGRPLRILFLSFLIFFVNEHFLRAQTFFVSGHDKYSVEKVVEKVKFEGYKVTPDSASSDYVVNLLIDGQFRFFSIKRAYRGYIMINDRTSGKEIGRTKLAKADPRMTNDYNASYTIFSRINRRYLPAVLKQCPRKAA